MKWSNILFFLYRNDISVYMGDTIAVFPLFTKKANEEAMERMNPRVTKSMWVSPSNANNISYALKLDAAATIYTATKV